jgi:enoyl-CoA hydratase/carnithine racemase
MTAAAGEFGVDAARHGRVLQLSIRNPAQRNAIKPEISAELARQLRLASFDDSIGAIVLRGEGEHFCAGGDLRTLGESRRTNPPQHHFERIAKLNELVRCLRDCPKPVVAAVEGHAAGAGFSVALGCDLIVAAEDAQFTMAYVTIGLNPDGDGSYFLARALPLQLASELMMTGAAIPATRLHSAGVVNRCVARGTAVAEALKLAQKLADGATGAIGRIKRLTNAAQAHDYSQHLEMERALFVEALHGDEAGEGIAAFLEKRKVRFHP